MAVRVLPFLRLSTSHLRRGARRFSIPVSLLTNHDDHAPTRGPPYCTDFDAARTPRTPQQVIPTYRVMDANGCVIDHKQDPQLSKHTLLRLYEQMVTLTLVDEDLLKAQRMGLISFYMKASGEEATHFGSAAGLEDTDMVYTQFRELGVLMWRGFTVDDIMDQCFSTKWEQGKGRQMPVHYGSREHNFQTVSSCVANQMPQATGYAYGLKLSGSKNCACTYFGDGGAQTGDSHAAMNFAATLGCPVVFFCRNNGYAISMPEEDSYAGDGIASRGQGYGIEAIRVDGNDVLAVYNVTKYARETAVKEHRPVLIEAMTYRTSSHSSSDDQTRYQPMETVKQWTENYNPVKRFRGYLQQQGLWDQDKEDNLREKVKEEVRKSMQRAMKEPKPHLDMLFTDVYDQLPPRLEKQRRELWEHVQKYKEHYPLEKFEA